jgi:molybdate transport system substrate-binding protein
MRVPICPALRGRPRVARLAAVPLLLIFIAALAAGCGSGPMSAGSTSSPAEIRVFAAASLTEAFGKIATDFSGAHPNVKVIFNFAGSQTLATQIEQGAPADVFASASPSSMAAVASLVEAPQPFAGNRLEIVVAKGNPMHVSGLADLARSDLKVVLGEPFEPAGKAALKALAAQHITVKPVSLEDTVKSVVTKVSLGEADAGIVWVTDVASASGSVDGVQIPNDQNIVTEYPIAVVKASKLAANAQAFVDFVLSTHGQQTVRQFDFLSPAATE